ncbi:PREDICTED: peptidyl-prolyl cis-trans isomerase-like 6 [Chrysochloris asiatica]|uniref:Probable inactive peptidyl-prolyl cis-trans isomerase-like 6 n=1 Tax=Chrysochloris asiatica TaxID=185453 RepID=A0A9B0TE40_CHRAS|nr:PREDICTED: peptidyl-prolyl cis-trans isomerase-like 6 [Chrysochloris asiatica]
MASPEPCVSKRHPCSQQQSPPELPLQVKVVGLFKSSSFQIAKSTAERLKITYPSKFEDPIIVPLQEFAWDQYLQKKKRELQGETWEYSSYVMCFINGQFLGDVLELQKWAHRVWDVLDVKPFALYEALTLDFSSKFLRDTKHDFVFLDVSIDYYPIGRLVFELYCDACPKTCKNFRVLCTGKAGYSQSAIRLHYKDSIFHRVVHNAWIQGGDIVTGRGDGGESIYGPTFEDENFSIPHNKKGVLGMVNKGPHSNGSQFYITLQSAPYLDRKYVAFGQLIEGTDVLKQLELVPTENERPIPTCVITDSGHLCHVGPGIADSMGAQVDALRHVTYIVPSEPGTVASKDNLPRLPPIALAPPYRRTPVGILRPARPRTPGLQAPHVTSTRACGGSEVLEAAPRGTEGPTETCAPQLSPEFQR